MAATSIDVQVSNNPNTGNVSFMRVTGDSGIPQPFAGFSSSTPELVARGFLSQFGGAFGLSNSDSELDLITVKQDRGMLAEFTVKFAQMRNGIPVVAGQINVHLDKDLQVLSANGALSSRPTSFQSARDTTISKNTALEVAAKNNPYASLTSLSATDPELVILNLALIEEGQNREYGAYKFVVTNQLDTIKYIVYLDAETNDLLLHYSDIKEAKNRTIYDQQNDASKLVPNLPSIRVEGGPPVALTDANNAYDFAGDTYDFYFTEHGRDSLDDAGFPLVSAVRYCDPFDACPLFNAFWTGSLMLYGQGLAVDDVVAHELTHGVTEFTSNLIYLNQSGAINESLSDVWGEFVDLTNGADNSADRWLLGEDAVPGGIRDMENPSSFGHPNSIGSPDYYCGSADFGGVHSNSGVNNKAASLMVDGGSFNGYTIAGIGIADTADIYYRAQTSYLTPSSSYQDLYNILNSSCSDIFGSGSAQCTTVTNAILAVEMNRSNACVGGESLTQCPVGETVVSSFSDGFESGNLSNWNVNNIVGTASWIATTASPFSGVYHSQGQNPALVTSSALELLLPVTVPDSAFLFFDHIANLEDTYDGGVVEYSVDSGSTWVDLLATQPVEGANYNTILEAGFGNPLGGRSAFSGLASYTKTKVDLSALSGQSMIMRFHIGTDSTASAPGWSIDNVDVYQCALRVQFCDGQPVTVDLNSGQQPTVGSDVILGTPSDDIIYGLGGNDVICGMGGSDSIYGGPGSDTIFGGDDQGADDSFNYLFGGNGDDFLFGGPYNDYLYGQGGADFLQTDNSLSGNADLLYGGSGNDTLISFSASGSLMRGQGNSDFLSGSDQADDMRGDPGLDTMYGNGGNDVMIGGNGADIMYGGAGDDDMKGNSARDDLFGDDGNDTLYGGIGNDDLDGGADTDICNGQGQEAGGLGDTSINCETVTGIPFNSSQASQLDFQPGRLSLTDNQLKLIDRCDLTLQECLAKRR